MFAYKYRLIQAHKVCLENERLNLMVKLNKLRAWNPEKNHQFKTNAPINLLYEFPDFSAYQCSIGSL